MSEREYDKGRPITGSTLLAAGLIVILGAACYSNTFHVQFLFDDIQYIVMNKIVHNFGAIADLAHYKRYGLVEDVRNNMVTRFVTYVTFALNYKAHELWPPGFHAVNLAIHLANALLVYRLLGVTAETFPPAEPPAENLRGRHGITLLPLAAALIFVSHPVQTNAVTYIVQRFTLLVTFFYLVALLAYVQSRRATSRRHRNVFYLLSLFSTVLAMYTKEIAFTLPLMVALYEFSFLEGEGKRRLKLLAPFFLTLLLLPVTVMGLAAISVDMPGSGIGKSINLVNFCNISRWNYFVTELRVVATYLRLMLFPAGLNIDYDYPLYTSLLHPEVLASGALHGALIATGGFLLVGSRKLTGGRGRLARTAGFGIFWFYLALAMESSIIPIDDVIFEYRLYLPSIGFIVAATAIANLVRESAGGMWVGRGLVGFAVIIIATCGVLTYRRNNVWRNETLLWEDTVRKSPRKTRVRCNLANNYAKRGRIPEAITQLRFAKTLPPVNGLAHYQLGLLYSDLGDYERAIGEYQETLRLQPKKFLIYYSMGKARLKNGEVNQAVADFRTALTFQPEDAETLRQLNDLEGRH